MNSPRLYNVFTAQFRFLDSTQSKIRPVIVVSKPYSKHEVIAAIPISSKINLASVDFNVSGLQNAGLLKASVAQVHKLNTVLQSDLITQLGSLEENDIKKLKDSLRKYLVL